MRGAIAPRVIAGEYRGRKLISPQNAGIRPTTDRVKESLFNILQRRVVGASFLDLFAGTGGIGLEALSRGAARAVFVDSGKESVEAVRENLKRLGCWDSAEIIRADYAAVLKSMDETFDIIYLDPPYESGFYAEAIGLIRQKRLLKPGGLIIAEHSGGLDANGLEIIDHRKYGAVELTFLGGLS